MGKVIDLTKQIPERGFFAPNREMLAKSQQFLQAVKAHCDKEGVQARFSRGGPHTYNIFIGGELYQLHNDGNEAALVYAGVVR